MFLKKLLILKHQLANTILDKCEISLRVSKRLKKSPTQEKID